MLTEIKSKMIEYGIELDTELFNIIRKMKDISEEFSFGFYPIHSNDNSSSLDIELELKFILQPHLDGRIQEKYIENIIIFPIRSECSFLTFKTSCSIGECEILFSYRGNDRNDTCTEIIITVPYKRSV